LRGIPTLRWLALAAPLLLAACSDPGLTENPLNTPPKGDPVVSVCYPPLVTRGEELTPVAAEGCLQAGVENAELRDWTKNLVFNECPLFKKARRSWFCAPGPAAAPPEGPRHELHLPPMLPPQDGAGSVGPSAPTQEETL
jgi:hypothetical protein